MKTAGVAQLFCQPCFNTGNLLLFHINQFYEGHANHYKQVINIPFSETEKTLLYMNICIQFIGSSSHKDIKHFMKNKIIRHIWLGVVLRRKSVMAPKF